MRPFLATALCLLSTACWPLITDGVGTGDDSGFPGLDEADADADADADGDADADADADADTDLQFDTDGQLEPCGEDAPDNKGYRDSLECNDSGAYYWDVYLLEVEAGDCVDIHADNGSGQADLLAFATDEDGEFYGMEADYSELDDDVDCTREPWLEGTGCPSARLTAERDGVFYVGVAQWGGSGCTDGAAYTLYLGVNGRAVNPEGYLYEEDVEL